MLTRLHTQGRLSRAQLTIQLGLNRSTIAALVGDLVTHGLAREVGVQAARGGAGRPSLVVEPASDRVCVLAADLGAAHLTVARVGLGGRVLDRRSGWRTPSGGVDEVSGEVAELCIDMRRAAGQDVRILGIGAAVPGVVRQSDGLIRTAPNLGWIDVPFAERLAAATGLSVAVGNDADAGVLAEHMRGAAVGYRDVIYLSGEVGVGGGVLVDGRPLAGVGGYAGEVGHLPLADRDVRCRCGSFGCWETQVGENALLVAAGRPAGEGLAAVRDVVRAAQQQDPIAAAAVEKAAHWLGVGTGALVNVFNPAIIVFGGALAEVFRAATPIVRAGLDSTAMAAAAEQVRLAPQALGDDSVLLGAAELAFRDVLTDPLGAVT
ncbi:MAG TPA: ROK family protein [Jiangellaceae bacterium]